MILVPLGAALAQAASHALDKVALGMRGVGYRAYLGASFPFLFVCAAVAFALVRPPFAAEALSGWLLVALVGSVLVSVGTNIFFYRALARDELQELQLIDLFREVPALLVVGALFRDERNPAVLGAALVASLAVFWAHAAGGRLAVRRSMLLFLGWSLVVTPFQNALYKVLLMAWHPVSLELARYALLALVFGPLFLHEFRRMSTRGFAVTALTNILTFVAGILLFFGYRDLGVVRTTLIYALMPLFVEVAALLFLREAVRPRKIVAFAVVLAAVVWGTVA